MVHLDVGLLISARVDAVDEVPNFMKSGGPALTRRRLDVCTENCTACAAGHASSRGSTSCEDCALTPGHIVDASRCAPCDAGSFALPDLSACERCPPGTVAAAGEATAQRNEWHATELQVRLSNTEEYVKLLEGERDGTPAEISSASGYGGTAPIRMSYTVQLHSACATAALVEEFLVADECATSQLRMAIEPV